MTKQPEKLNPLGERILELMRTKPGEWLTRSEVAALIGRDYLTPHDMRTLDYLASEGLIEMRKHTIGLVKTRYEYRVTS